MCIISLHISHFRLTTPAVVCLVHNNSHVSFVCRQHDYVLVSFQLFQCFQLVSTQVADREADCKVEVILFLY